MKIEEVKFVLVESFLTELKRKFGKENNKLVLEVNCTHQIIYNSMEDRIERELHRSSSRKRLEVSTIQIR